MHNTCHSLTAPFSIFVVNIHSADDYVRYQPRLEISWDVDDLLFKLSEHSKGENLSVFHTNIRSINKNKHHLEVLLHAYEHMFDVIILTECWKLSNVNIIKNNRYKTYYNEGNINKCDGVVMMVKNGLEHRVDNVVCNNFKFLRLILNHAGMKTAITGVYRLPSSSKCDFLISLENYVNFSCNAENELLIGDMNINLLNEDDCTEYMNLLQEKKFISLVNEATRETDKSKTCIDHAFIKTKLKNENIYSVISKSKITDHSPVIVSINLGNSSPQFKTSNSRRELSKIDYSQLKKNNRN